MLEGNMTDNKTVAGAHLVGSAPVESAEQMFSMVCDHLGQHVKRIGDGEIGERDTWALFQCYRLAKSPQLEVASFPLPMRIMRYIMMKVHRRKIPPIFAVKPGITDPGQVELPDLGYAEAAISSYKKFREMKESGKIPSHIRFMVGLPTPLGVVSAFIELNSRAVVLPAYQAKMLGELQQILDAIPHDQLSIQWEAVFELMMLEGHKLWKYHGENMEADLRAHFAMLLNTVPEDVECGFHLCYGDAGHKHFLEPPDTSVMTGIANNLVADSKRPLNFLHLPVPKERDDLAYFEPLRDLRLKEETDLYLGLVHATGGADGTERRIETARQVVDRFGIATECGFGRRPAESIPGLLKQHCDLASPLK
jgi:hypothetical protein